MRRAFPPISPALSARSEVDRSRFLKMMRDYAEFANFELNWDEINKTGTADLVNFACMVSPYGAREKQVLLEANSLAPAPRP